MKKLLKVVLTVNLITAVIVWGLSQYVPAFSATSLSDFLFYIVIVIWGVAGLTWEGAKESRNWGIDPAAKKTRSMVSEHDFSSDHHNQQRDNYKFGFMMFIAGLPALLGCIVLQWL